MSEQKEKIEQRKKRTLRNRAAQLMREGAPRFKIEKMLIEEDMFADEIQDLIRSLEKERQVQWDQKHREEAMRNMAIGGVICLIGLAVSVCSFQAASSLPSGGSYVVAWGAVVFGGIQFFKGLYQLMQ